MKDDFNTIGKDPIDSERLTIVRIIGAIIDEMFLISEIGIGSRSQ